jgi:hypothetical protein
MVFATQGAVEQFVWFENSGHMPMTEEPGKFLLSLVHYVWPIAERARDLLPSRPRANPSEPNTMSENRTPWRPQ